MTPDIPVQLPSLEEALEETRRERRSVRWFGAFFVLAFFVLACAIGYVITSYQPKTACQTDPSGRECQAIKIDSDLARSASSACVVTVIAGYGCPALGLGAAEADQLLRRLGEGKAARTPEQRRGDSDAPDADAPSGSGGGGGSATAPSGGGGGGGVDGGSGDPQPAPQDPGADPDPAPPPGGDGPGTDPGGDPTPPSPTPEGPPTLGDQVGDTVDSLTTPACSRLPQACGAVGLP